ncbi:4-hydroxy-tetrahydrodipicolinate synthase [Rouxiella badensis]|jgi:4-hydroxy-tetrahydrodipicolinate synthase|uniref:4-hydroxy-tetrahydrodipicolinate synthase n=1 Tax=Rouxiella badensis TaxID=1646377 RepID=A0A1X0WEI3_9GAMM|nr:4-hydroxy-tetrahydrodipicolinate synthase [Rouxiella badensis]MCC3701435.1 4-hydroxy-tetrahydrodipicolinate synthase [Rouxiella badensis]MCC3717862.1 4-hydroxy-tetrahydrodipicolinate synthase [Rouxiella badensis]MCC3730123.1 4-hydroxy-tetrahydrodipicolinate synthase [Rouxiella badensis]MCC3739205.1 4-hydroxy-tetrahydrodipicolinate synthase [Rouxiella badensis]MCC3746125.1 4-hydroxy-tetrahydrodipicolinate synthase [Rouxiella badensis]
MSIFSGIWVPLVTPFNQGEIDFPALTALCQHVMDRGVDGVVVCGTTGEAPMLSKEEQLQVLDAVLTVVPGNKVMMGLSGTHMPSIVAMQKAITERPIAGILLPAPYYIRPSQAALEAFFTQLADSSSVPIVVYNVPYRSGIHLELETLRRLAKHPRIVAVKDCGGSTDLTYSLIADGELDVLCGEDGQILATLCMGGNGAIAASSHLFPEKFVALVKQVQACDLAAARENFFQLMPLIRLMFAAPNPASIKFALSLGGLMQNELRAPMLPAPAEVEEAIVNYLNTFSR